MVQQIEVGLVSADDSLAEFYAAVFGMERLPATQSRSGVVHRLQAPGTVIKVMVPSRTPASAGPAELFAVTGLRYLTLYVTDLDGTIERAMASGGHVRHGPMDIGPGVRLAILTDPDGNAMEVLDGAR
jgi:predicted enzyme related to lactoylglutathione lyase